MSKKVLHITHTDIRSDSRILKEMSALAAVGYTVNGIGVAHEEGAKLSAITFETKITVVKLFTRTLTFLPRTFRHGLSICELAIKMLPEVIRQRPDIIHCHDTLALPLGIIANILFKNKLIYDAHELESNRNGLTKLQGKLTSFVENLAWRYIDALIVVSPSIDTWYKAKFGPKLSAVILNAPLFSDNYYQDSNYLRKLFKIPPHDKIFIYVGILGRGRGIELITEAFIHHNISAHAVFLGYGELTEALKQLEIENSNIHVHEAVPHSQVVPIVQSADYGLCLIQNVSLSDYYCLPNKLFEYCFAGVPVLASDFPDIRIVLEKYNIGECCELNAETIRSSIRRLEGHDTQFQFADLKPLSWQAQETKLVNLYQSVQQATDN